MAQIRHTTDDQLLAAMDLLPDAHLLMSPEGKILGMTRKSKNLFSALGILPNHIKDLLPEATEWEEFGLMTMARYGELDRDLLFGDDPRSPMTTLACRSSMFSTGSSPELRVALSIRDVTPERKTQDNLRRLSMTDDLTGLPNRRYLKSLILFDEERARRCAKYLAILFVDIDKFKLINDHHGHNVGDEAIKTFGQVLQRCLRKIDTVCRWGGDEFVVIAICNDEEHAEALPRRILAATQGKTFPISGLELTLEATVGMAMSRCGVRADPCGERLLDRADQLMLDAKKRSDVRYLVEII